MKTLVILSGGQDSATCLFWAIREFGRENVSAITFFYGQNHEVELDCSALVCENEKVHQLMVDLSFLPGLVESALTSQGDVNQVNEKGLPASFVPNRNALFITLAHAYAQKIGAANLVTGVCQTDYSGYPDCREYFVSVIGHALNAGSDSEIKILTPLMHLTKAQTFELAADLGKLGSIIEFTNTCYNGDRKTRHEWGYGCGECPACKLREKGWNEYTDASGFQKDSLF